MNRSTYKFFLIYPFFQIMMTIFEYIARFSIMIIISILPNI